MSEIICFVENLFLIYFYSLIGLFMVEKFV